MNTVILHLDGGATIVMLLAGVAGILVLVVLFLWRRRTRGQRRLNNSVLHRNTGEIKIFFTYLAGEEQCKMTFSAIYFCDLLQLRMYCIDTGAIAFMFNGGSYCGSTIHPIDTKICEVYLCY